MTVCANRSDDPGFFTPCKQCPCGAAVKAELAAEKATAEHECAYDTPGAGACATCLSDTNLDNQENP